MSDLAAALGRIPSGLFVVTCRRDNEESAFLASWIQQCSFDPPMLSLAVRRGRPIGEWLRAGTPFSVHILSVGQRELLSHFGKGLPLDQLPRHEERVQRQSGQAPLLTEALAVLHCTPTEIFDSGDHHLVLARITEGALFRSDEPMVHVRKSGLNY
ncbi:MAG: flavin reductase family protein [Gemmataceae bacterium]|nr:flavin reductase family protein [Gemmataceae bacterium]